MRILKQRPTYTSCDDLPLANFIKIVCTGELVHLYSEPSRFIHRNAPLADIWEHIFNEYNELTNNTQSKHVFNLIKEITVLGNRIGIVNDCVNLLRSVDDVANYPDCISILNSYGCSHITITNENRHTQLDRCITVCKRYIADLNKVETEYNTISNDDQKKVTPQDFYSMIAVVSKFMGGKDIDLHKTTVSLYISYINLMKANTEQNG